MRVSTLTQGFEIFIQTTRIGNIVLFFVRNRDFNSGFRCFLTPENTEVLLVILDQFFQNASLQQPVLLFKDTQTGSTLSCLIQQQNLVFILGFYNGNISVVLNKLQAQVLKRTLMYYPVYVMIENGKRQVSPSTQQTYQKQDVPYSRPAFQQGHMQMQPNIPVQQPQNITYNRPQQPQNITYSTTQQPIGVPQQDTVVPFQQQSTVQPTTQQPIVNQVDVVPEEYDTLQQPEMLHSQDLESAINELQVLINNEKVGG